MKTDTALIVVDYENSFIPESEWWTWELWVEGWWLLYPAINELIKDTKAQWGIVIGTRDWHPKNHISFASNHPWKQPFIDSLEDGQELWPDHCIAETPGAEYFNKLDVDKIDYHIIKWEKYYKDAYSGFEWREMIPYDLLPNPWERNEAEMIEKGWQISEAKKIATILKGAWVNLVKIVWLATDYCVNATALDALKNGFNVEVIEKAIAWVDPSQSVKRLEELREKWAIIT